MKRSLSIILVVLMVVSLFAGCGQTTPSASPSASSQAPAQSATPAPAKDVTLTFFNFYQGEGAAYGEKFPEAVKAKFPNITIEMETLEWNKMHATLQTKIASNEIPDLLDFKAQDVPTYAKTGILMDLTGKAFMSNVPEAALTNIKVDGKDYGIPYTALYQGVLYNRKIFTDNGLTVPKTYAELMTLCKTLQDKGITPFATHFMDSWNIGNMTMQFAMADVFSKNPNWGKDLFAGKTSFSTSPEYKAVFEHVKDMYGYTFKDTFSYDLTKCDELFAKGEAAMNVTGTWTISNIDKVNPELDYGIFPFPGVDPGAKLIFEPNHTFSGSAKSENVDAITQVLEFVATDKELAQFCADSSVTHSLIKDVSPSYKNPTLSDIDTYKKDGNIADVSLGNVQIVWPYQDEYSKYIQEWLLGGKTLEDALKAADDYKSKVTQ